MNESLRERLRRRHSTLKNARSPFDAVWRRLGEYILPWGALYLTSDTDTAKNGFELLHNPYATDRAERAAAVIHASVTSPARPWFRYLPFDTSLMKRWQVRDWLFAAEETTRDLFARSNIYRMFPTAYLDELVFGTHCSMIDEDEEDGIRAYMLPIGTYCLTQSYRRLVNGVLRECTMTVEQLYEFWATKDDGTVDKARAEQIFTRSTRDAFTQGKYDTPVRVLQVVEPNALYEPGSAFMRRARWASVYLELGQDAEGKVLEERGYHEFPAVAPRWATVGDFPWGRGPGWKTLPDVKELQTLRELATDGLDRMVDPSLAYPSSIRNDRKDTNAGGSYYYNPGEGQQPIYAPHVPNLHFEQLLAYQGDIKEGIDRAFFTDLIQMVSNDPHAQPDTAREIAEKHEEKMLLMGPFLESVQSEAIEPACRVALAVAARRGMLPPPPEELVNGWLQVECVNVFHQAQKMLGLGSIERFGLWLGNMAQFWPSILDKFNPDEAADVYAQWSNVPPKLVASDEQLEKIRAAKAQQEQAAQMAAAAPAAEQASKAALALSQADPTKTSMLQQLVQQVAPGAQ